jgi:hypothetical protein
MKLIKHSGADWMAKQNCFKSPSALGIKVADILGQVYLGIYHIDNSVTNKKVDWGNKSEISVTISSELATFDSAELTFLIFCCIELNVSVQISGVFKGYLKLTFRESDLSVDLLRRAFYLDDECFTAEKIARLYAKKPPLLGYQDPYNAGFSASKSFEMDELVDLVLLAHAAMVRVSLRGRSFGVLQMQFCQRASRKGACWDRHPDLAQAQARFPPMSRRWRHLRERIIGKGKGDRSTAKRKLGCLWRISQLSVGVKDAQPTH